MVTFVTPKSGTLPSDSILTQSPRVAIHGPTVQTKGLMKPQMWVPLTKKGIPRVVIFLSHCQTMAILNSPRYTKSSDSDN